MKTVKSTLAALSMGFIAFSGINISADETEERNVMVQIHKSSDKNTKVDLNVNGQAEVFNLPDLQVGETKDILSEDGNSISITRNESDISVLINGEVIQLPAPGNHMSAHIMKGGMPLHTNVSKGVQVIGDLTEEQIAIIKDGFAAAGVEKEINFTKGHEMRFFSIDGEGGNFDIEIDGDSDINQWISKDGSEMKVIKFKGKEGEQKIHVKHKVILIEEEENQ